MKKLLVPLFLGLVMLPVTGRGALRKWNAQMQELAKLLNEMVPEMSESNSDTAGLEKHAKKLAELAQGLGVNPGHESLLPPDADPTLGFVQDLFARETKRGYHAIKSGYVDYGKGILRNTTAYCVACHSRNSSGPDFPSISLSPKTDSLSPFEKAQLLAATRQFDGAIEMLTTMAGDEAFAKSRPMEWSRAVKQGLTLAVRVKEDPDKGLAVLEKASKVQAPNFAIQNTQDWKVSLLAWKKEKEKRPTTEAALHRRAKALLEKAKAQQQFLIDRSADVLYLRASALLHEQLRLAPRGELAPEGLFLLGRCYEVLGELDNAPWHETFYEACIRQRPHSPLARSCFEAFESSVHFGYSGSGGFALPEDVQQTLSELRKLAATKKK